MGANAQTSVPTFTAGEILTAANMNISARTGIPVFADTTARDAAFGGTGEKTLAEGQYAYIENIAGSAATQFYDGAAWQTLVSSGLTLISTTTIGTTVASVTVSNAFSATYDNYLITVDGGVASTDNVLQMTLGATATGYYYFGSYNQYSSSASPSGDGAQNTTKWIIGVGSANSLNSVTTVTNPFAAKNSHFLASAARSATNGIYINYGGYLANTTSYTAFTLTTSTGTLTGGTIRVYGYANS